MFDHCKTQQSLSKYNSNSASASLKCYPACTELEGKLDS